jgi:hypothetical protein
MKMFVSAAFFITAGKIVSICGSISLAGKDSIIVFIVIKTFFESYDLKESTNLTSSLTIGP